MKINRQALLSHLRATYCGGLVGEAVFSEGFAVSARANDGTMVLQCEGIEGIDQLPESVGVVRLEKLVKALNITDAEDAEVRLEDGRLYAEAGGAAVSLVTASDLAGIQSHVAVDAMALVRSMVADGKPSPLSVDLAGKIRAVHGVVEGDEIALEGTPKGSRFVIGQATSNQGVVEAPDVKTATKCRILFSKTSLLQVLSMVTEGATILAGNIKNNPLTNEPGPGMAQVSIGSFDYFLSPIEEG